MCVKSSSSWLVQRFSRLKMSVQPSLFQSPQAVPSVSITKAKSAAQDAGPSLRAIARVELVTGTRVADSTGGSIRDRVTNSESRKHHDTHMDLEHAMKTSFAAILCIAALVGLSLLHAFATPGGDEPISRRNLLIDGSGPHWRALGEKDFVNVNCAEDTWTWKDDLVHCTGKPVGVIRLQKPITNFELVVEWRHLRSGGNSGVFAWASPESIKRLEMGKGRLPHGIEVQVLYLGYAERYEKRHKKKSDWFTSHGDVFPTGPAKMKPFPPVAPNGKRSFPSKELTKGINEWNHYYVRAINGEVRLWVNGEEVSGGTGCQPATGYLCLESEGSPLEFRGLRLRELP